MNFDYGAYGYDQIFVNPDFSGTSSFANRAVPKTNPKEDINHSLRRSLNQLESNGTWDSHVGSREALQNYMNSVVQPPKNMPRTLLDYEKMYNDLKYENYILYIVLFFVVVICLIMNNNAFDKGMQYGINIIKSSKV
jgi:hypothetical protein